MWVSLKFVIYTLANSTSLLGLVYLFWGVILLVALIVPFAASFYAIFLLFEAWQIGWNTQRKILATILLVGLTQLLIIFFDLAMRATLSQSIFKEFVEANQLNISGR